MAAKRKSVFISYAHIDGMEFTETLAEALDIYMDVFWDDNLRAGELQKQLDEKIEEKDCLLFVRTPCSMKSEWCNHEFDYALGLGKEIGLARVYADESSIDSALIEKYNKYKYADFFTKGFEFGFRELTKMLLGKAYWSWEYLKSVDDKKLLEYLGKGRLPGFIAEEFGEWVIVEYLPKFIDQNILEPFYKGEGNLEIRPHPRTISGFQKYLEDLKQRCLEDRYFLVVDLLGRLDIFCDLGNTLSHQSEKSHLEIGIIVANMIKEIMRLHEKDMMARRDFLAYPSLGFVKFNVTEKLRELILVHSRRSRYLY